MWDSNTNKTGSTILKEWTTPDCRNTPSTTNLEEEVIVDAPGNDGNASMPEQVKRPDDDDDDYDDDDDDDDDDVLDAFGIFF